MTREEIRRVDASGMYEAIRQFPEQLREGRALARRVTFDLDVRSYRQVVVVGMGGSAIGGDLLRTLAADEAPRPVLVSRSYRLPAWVDAETLVVVSSYSGNTEETLAAMDVARDRQATLVCMSSNGQVQERAEAEALPLVQVPGGMQPRAALGYSLAALLVFAEQIGLLPLGDAAWDEAGTLLDALAEAYGDPAGRDNEARDLAEALQHLLPFVYSGTGLLEAVNLRWQTQIQENAKRLATGNLFPELNHNEIMGWEQPAGLHAQIGVVVLRDQADHARVQRRIRATRELIAEKAGSWLEVETQGEGKLARVLSLVHLGDWMSFYLALLHGVDPTPVDLISQLKDTLAGS